MRVELEGLDDSVYGDTEVVLPGKKQKVKVELVPKKAAPQLSKKKRKELEKVLDRKKKKENVCISLV